MSLQGVRGFAYEFGGLKPVQIEVSEAPLTSDAGLLPVRQFDERIGFTERLAAAIGDRRDPNAVDHTVLTMLRQRPGLPRDERQRDARRVRGSERSRHAAS